MQQCKPRSRWGWFILFYCCLCVFIIYSPPMDIFIARQPYNFVTHKFYGNSSWWCELVYSTIPIITMLFVLVCSAIILLANQVSRFRLFRRLAIIILVALALGPGLIVNVILKDNWGRPRPYQVLNEGKVFSPVWQPNFRRHNDNSFPSGHAAIGFFLGVPFLVQHRRTLGVIIGVGGGSVVGLVRILQGGHYFSDVVLCGIIVWLSSELVCYIIDKRYFK